MTVLSPALIADARTQIDCADSYDLCAALSMAIATSDTDSDLTRWLTSFANRPAVGRFIEGGDGRFVRLPYDEPAEIALTARVSKIVRGWIARADQ